jgi:hypothetical protein
MGVPDGDFFIEVLPGTKMDDEYGYSISGNLHIWLYPIWAVLGKLEG